VQATVIAGSYVPFITNGKPHSFDSGAPCEVGLFRVQVSVTGSYSANALETPVPRFPVPIYPLLPIENAAARDTGIPGKSAFRVQILVDGSYSQKSLARPLVPPPVPIYPLPPIENPTAPPLAVPPKSAFCVHIPCVTSGQGADGKE
jgi:hypothetical protein